MGLQSLNVQPEVLFLGTFAKLRKTTINFTMSVCMSVRPSVSLSVCPHGTSRLPVGGFS